MVSSTRGSPMSMGWRAMACSTSSGTGDGPGDCKKRRPGMREVVDMDAGSGKEVEEQGVTEQGVGGQQLGGRPGAAAQGRAANGRSQRRSASWKPPSSTAVMAR